MSEPQDRWAWVSQRQGLGNNRVLTTDELNQALQRQPKTRERLGQIFIAMKLIENASVGIPPEIRERIFYLFFTTKAHGTGLGLPIARQIVEAHHGTLTMETDGASETRFIVELPTTAPVMVAGARP